MQTIVTDVSGVYPSVCLSHGSTRLHCAKTAQWIKMLFERNTLGDPWNIVLHGGPDLPQRGRGGVGKIMQTVDQLHISGMVEARDLKFCVQGKVQNRS